MSAAEIVAPVLGASGQRRRAEQHRKQLVRAHTADLEAEQRFREGYTDPLSERRTHGAVVRLEEQLADVNGDIGLPYRALNTLETMERNGTIGRRQLIAGERFHDAFRRAGLDNLRAAALVRVPGPAAWWRDGAGNEAARRLVAGSIRLLGGEGAIGASCAWHVLGLEWSLAEWREKQQIAKIASKLVASGVLVGVLDVLIPEFGA